MQIRIHEEGLQHDEIICEETIEPTKAAIAAYINLHYSEDLTAQQVGVFKYGHDSYWKKDCYVVVAYYPEVGYITFAYTDSLPLN